MAENYPYIELLNADFGVDEDLSAEDASPLSLVVPQFYQGQSTAPKSTGAQSPNPWDPRLVMDLTLAIDSHEEILERYGLTDAQYNRLMEVPSFRRDLAVALRDNRENGVSYAAKARVQAESYLVHVDELVNDQTVAASTRLDAVKWITKMGRLEPKEEKSSENSGVQVNLQINFT
jgi:hypothetical protein